MRKNLKQLFFSLSSAILLMLGLFVFAQQFTFTKDTLNLGKNNPNLILAYTAIKIDDAWEATEDASVTFSEPIKIGVIDSGIDSEHPEFQDVNLGNTPQNAKFDHDSTGHGTQITGIIGANNISADSPLDYVSPQMNGIVSGIKDLDYVIEHRFDGGPTLYKVLFDIFVLADIRSSDIVNISHTFQYPNCNSVQTNLLESLFFGVLAPHLNTLFVVSAGEVQLEFSDAECFVPGALGGGTLSLPNVINVGGTTPEDDRDPTSPFGEAVNIAAPSVSVYAPRPPFIGEPEGQYDEFFGGTSASAPLVTGVAAILKSIKPELTPPQIKSILTDTNNTDPVITDPNKPIGRRLNAFKAVCDPMVLNCESFGNIWPMFGHNPFHNLATTFNGPAVEPTIQWEFTLLTGGFGQPVIGPDGTIYAGALDNSLFAIDENGNEKWKFDSFDRPMGLAVNSDSTIYFGGTTVRALDSTGSQSWSFNAGNEISNITQASNGDLYFPTEFFLGRLTALKPDGTLKWQADGNRVFDYAPIVPRNGIVYIPSFQGLNPRVHAYSEDTGDELFSLSLSSVCFCVISDISYDEIKDKIYAALGGYIVEIEPDGSSFSKLNIAPGGVSSTIVSIGDDNLYIGFDFSLINPASRSVVFAVDNISPIASSSIKWSFFVNDKINPQMPLDKDENIYFSTQKAFSNPNAKLYSLNKNGGFRWSFELEDGFISVMSPLLDGNGGIVWGDVPSILKLE